MQVVIFIGFIVFAVAFATIIQQGFLKRISVNYIAMAIVAPLLFFEGQRTRLYNVLRSWRAIVGLTVIILSWQL